jgi:hypothetical protein
VKKKRARIKLLRIDEADFSVGLRAGQVLVAKAVTSSGGQVFYIVKAPLYGPYYINADQVEKVS